MKYYTNENHFIFSGHDTVELAKKYGTPLYVMSENIIRENAKNIIDAFKKHHIDFKVVYAGKALSNMAMCRIVHSLGMGLDVVSAGELYTAKKSSFPMEDVCFHGNNKSIDELNMAIDFNVGRIIVDSDYELEILNKLSLKKGKTVDILFRVNPGISAHTHKYIQTGQEDSKFGISIKEVGNIIKKAVKMEGVIFKGIHCHIGSQILDKNPYEIAASTMMDFMYHLNKVDGIKIDELNLGGGFGIAYSPEEHSTNMSELVDTVVKVIKDKALEYEINMPKIMVEPGRYIVGNAGITLYEIGAIKEISNVRKYVSVNGGMADNPRTALYGAKYSACIANKMDVQEREVVSISGKCCESGDMLIWDISLPPCESGDIIAVLCTGAYNYSMASNYNRIPKPPMVLLRDKDVEIMVEGESIEDIIRKDRIPSWLL